MGNTRGGTLRQSQKVGIGLLLTGNTKWPLVVSYYTTGSNSRYLLVSVEDDRVARRKARATTSFSSLVVAISFQYRTWKPFVDLKFYCCHVASSSAVFLSWSSTTILAWLMVSAHIFINSFLIDWPVADHCHATIYRLILFRIRVRLLIQFNLIQSFSGRHVIPTPLADRQQIASFSGVD